MNFNSSGLKIIERRDDKLYDSNHILLLVLSLYPNIQTVRLSTTETTATVRKLEQKANFVILLVLLEALIEIDEHISTAMNIWY